MSKKKYEWKRIKEPTENMLAHYEKLFRRNQNKWMRRSKMEESHFGAIFEKKGKEYQLLGSVDNRDNMLVAETNGENYYFVHSDVIDSFLLEKE